MQKITPFLWFDNNAQEAVKFYKSIFKKSKIGKTLYYDQSAAKASGMPAGSLLTIDFEIEGQKFIAMNGGPHVKFNEAVSFMIHCKTQAELDRYWKKLSAGGKEVQCGWLQDKYGVFWQIVPAVLFDLLNSKDRAAASRVFQVVLNSVKLDIKALKAAHAGKKK